MKSLEVSEQEVGYRFFFYIFRVLFSMIGFSVLPNFFINQKKK